MYGISRRALCGIPIAAAIAGTAIAAKPDTGTVSVDSPKVTWLGEISDGSYIASRAMIVAADAGRDGDAPCEQGCDTFTLTVADQKDLTIAANSPGEDASDPDQVVIRVKKPDDSYLTTVGDSTKAKPLQVKFKNAAKGEYVIDYANNYAFAQTYDGSAALAVPAATPAPPPSDGGGGGGGTPAAPPQPPAPTTGGTATGPAQNINVSVRVGRTSARRLKKSRKLRATVTVSREVAKVTAFLRKGRKQVAKGRRGKTAGSARITLKLSKKAARKLKKGKYTLTVVANDAKGATASKTIRVTVRK